MQRHSLFLGNSFRSKINEFHQSFVRRKSPFSFGYFSDLSMKSETMFGKTVPNLKKESLGRLEKWNHLVNLSKS